jgi:hemolysin activation/secretion protein
MRNRKMSAKKQSGFRPLRMLVMGCMVGIMVLGQSKVFAQDALTDLETTKSRIRQLEAELAQLRAKMRVQAGKAGYLPRIELPESKADVQPVEDDGAAYNVSELIVQYARSHAGHPALEDVLMISVDLIRTETGFVSPREDVESTPVRLVDLQGVDNVQLYGSAIRKISVAIVDYFNKLGIIGVFVGPDRTQIDQRGQDIRPEGDTSLRLIIRTAVVAEMRSLASGQRVSDADRINNPVHNRILRNMPVQPSDGYNDNDLLNKKELDRYVSRLNRHPGRRVDVAVSASEDADPGSVALDLLITENKPWLAYFQISNTGTQSTNPWRERFGLTFNQLTNNDDILSIDYITSSFSESHSLVASYEAPLGESQTIRWRVDGLYSIYSSEDVAFANERFTAESWQIGGQLIFNVYNENNHFIDLFTGLSFNDESVQNDLVVTDTGEVSLLWATIGAKYENRTDIQSTYAQLSFKTDLIGIAGAQNEDFNYTGRGDTVAEQQFILSWYGSKSFFLEPLLNHKAWADTSTPESSTLAHELYFATSGQYTFGKRVLPSQLRTVGGLYSVRGYEESEASGDAVVQVTAEYRLHIPKLFALEPDPCNTPLFGQPFRWAPQTVYGPTDWDLMFKTFVDYAHTRIESDPANTAAENDKDLLGVGVGLEFLYKRNLSIRADWGFALIGTDTFRTDAGDSRFHVAATVLY